jgi:hypothetical protein
VKVTIISFSGDGGEELADVFYEQGAASHRMWHAVLGPLETDEGGTATSSPP